MTASVLPSGGPPIGGITQSFRTADYAGNGGTWVRADGRAVTALTVTQRASAAIYGWTVNLPDASGAEIVDSAAAIGTTTTVDTFTVTQANLPAFTMTGGTLDHDDNNHRHVIDTVQSAQLAVSGSLVKGNSPGNPFNVSIGQGGAHDHDWSIPSGGAGTPISAVNPYMSANLFVFL